ncbi:MAG: phosphocholine cytidylyltransferase family protein [Candidatus Aminicenantes bacterium]|nr:phosphocholine cytidylyltransferase family protein [Candidatus Aminicenantes bacterium]
MKTKHALFLAAGSGNRLLPLTKDLPKSLLLVNRKSILENALTHLAEAGVERVVIVIGHLGQLIRDCFGDSFLGMRLEYMENPIYQSTNSMYSLHLGLQEVSGPIWILEGDVVFDGQILHLPRPAEISWFVDSQALQMDGAFLQTDQHGIVQSLRIIRPPEKAQMGNFKSIGILHLSMAAVPIIQKWLSGGLANQQSNLYYDLIFADHLEERLISVVDIHGSRWFEIDTPADLKAAQELFK